MSHSSTAPQDPLAAAAVEAVLAARWECTELLSRRPSLLAAELLRGHAAELATSALAGDQVLSLALETAAGDIEAGRPPLEGGAMFLVTDASGADGARRSLRGLVLRQPGEPSPPPGDVVAEIERRCADEGLAPSQLAGRLTAASRLQQALRSAPPGAGLGAAGHALQRPEAPRARRRARPVPAPALPGRRGARPPPQTHVAKVVSPSRGMGACRRPAHRERPGAPQPGAAGDLKLTVGKTP